MEKLLASGLGWAGHSCAGCGWESPTSIAYLDVSLHPSRPCVLMMWTGLCSCCSLCLECPSFLSFQHVHPGYRLPPTSVHWHHFKEESRNIMEVGVRWDSP